METFVKSVVQLLLFQNKQSSRKNNYKIYILQLLAKQQGAGSLNKCFSWQSIKMDNI